MIAFLLILILLALIAPSLVRLIAVLIGIAFIYLIISISAQACEGVAPLPRHYSTAELQHRADHVALFGSCVVADPRPPLNARSMPGTGAGMIVRHLDNGTEVAIKQTSGNWVYVSGECDDQIGWVYRPLILCR
jgi:hypothetical protein